MTNCFFKLLIIFSIFLNYRLVASLEPPDVLIVQDLYVSDATKKVEINDVLRVHFDGWIFDKEVITDNYCNAKGKKIASTQEKPFRHPPSVFIFEFGKGILMPGWEIGLVDMLLNSKRCLVIPPQLAYGARGLDNIPSFSTLIFEIELVDIQRIKVDDSKKN